MNKTLDKSVDYRILIPTLRPNASSDPKQAAINKGIKKKLDANLERTCAQETTLVRNLGELVGNR